MKKQGKNKTRGNLMSLAGLIMILINVVTLIFREDGQFIVGTLGLLFFIIGINISKKS